MGVSSSLTQDHPGDTTAGGTEVLLLSPTPPMLVARTQRVNVHPAQAGREQGILMTGPCHRELTTTPSLVGREDIPPHVTGLFGKLNTKCLKQIFISDCYRAGQFLKTCCLFLFMMIKITHVHPGAFGKHRKIRSRTL